DYSDFVETFFASFLSEYKVIETNLELTKTQRLLIGDGAMILIDLLKRKILQAKHTIDAWDDFVNPPHGFIRKTVFTLIMALTHQAKKISEPMKLQKWINDYCFAPDVTVLHQIENVYAAWYNDDIPPDAELGYDEPIRQGEYRDSPHF
ncbi:MAG TPA: hypothetical protein VLS94_07410, partial [Fusibacter sp.]|nr:hypothetical protein [Fusibacter sp.]